MSEEAPSDAGRRFAADLRSIREARGVSIESLHDETKIPLSLLESFESTGLFDHPMFNRVYLRSFVRTYADVSGISASVALAALEQALDGTYTDRLAVEYLGKAPAASPEPAPSETAPAHEEPSAPAAEPEAPNAASAGPSEGRDEQPAEMTSTPARADAPRATPEARPGGGSGGASPAWEDVEPTPSPRQDRPASPARSAERSPVPTGETPRRQWIVVGVVAVVLVAAVWGVIAFVGGDDEDPGVEGEPVTQEVAPDPAAETPAESARPAISVGDTIDVRVVSTGEPVRWLRVTIDDDVRRPYWIEAGDSRLFGAAERMVIEDAPADRTTGQLERIRLEVEGETYPMDRRDDQGRIVLTRDALAEYYAASQ